VSERLDPAELHPLLERLEGFTDAPPGATRPVYGPAWCAAQSWLAGEAERRGLAVTADWAGNLFLHPPRLAAGARALFVGSHVDTVAHGGRYDGAYGAVAGLLLAAARLGAEGAPVVGFVTSEEEGSRFPGSMMGARSLLGLATRQEYQTLRDRDGVTWAEALAAARPAARLGAGEPGAPPFAPAAMLELHIEQGPVLEAEGLALGIVEHVAGYRRLRAHVTGAARHSGTTPMGRRRDALAAAAEMVLAAEAAAREAGEPAVATAGRAQAEPGLFNVVPGACELWLDVRHADPAALERLERDLLERCHAIATRRRVDLALETASLQDPVPLSRPLADAAAALAAERRIAHRRMNSGAAHDAMIFAQAGVPALMLFVPCRDGISHSPDEYAEPAQLAGGVSFAAALIERLAARPELARA